MRKWFSEVFWSQKGRGEFVLNGKHFPVQENEVFFLTPGEMHDMRATITPHWNCFWLTLDHPESRKWLEELGFERRPFTAPPCPVGKFRALRKSLDQGTSIGDRQAANYAHIILLAAMEMESRSLPLKNGESRHEKCRHYIDEHYKNPKLSVAEIAEMIGIHRATLFRIFKQQYKVTPSHYLQSLRVHQGMELLKQTDLPIKEIANRIGLPDANYFGRLLQKTAHTSPQAFRSEYRMKRSVFC